MQPSPLQLTDLFFVHSDIRPRIEPDVTSLPTSKERFSFNNTVITTTVEHAIAPEDDESPVSRLLVTLRFVLEDEGDAPPPYLVDVKCIGYFTIHKSAFPDPVKRLDVGVVNGASMLYGSLREHIFNATARMWYGEMLLPSVNFLEDAPSQNHQEAQPDVPVEKPRKTRKQKSA